MATNGFRLAIIQLSVGISKSDNLLRASNLVAKAAETGAKVVALPECCNSPYGNDYFEEYAETIPGNSTEVFSKCAKENKVYLVAGSIPEKDGTSLFNTCTVFNPEGSMIAKYRKMHLFDIDIPGKITFQESKTLSPGSSLVTFDTPYCKIGLGICYDIRFAPLAQLYAKLDCQLVLYPGAFNMTTGPAHWSLLARSRALDNQMYIASVSPARDVSAKYNAWGHSLVASPWGDVLVEADESEDVLFADIDLDKLQQIRDQIPIRKQQRNDVYDVCSKK